jgi:hypothetical protein
MEIAVGILLGIGLAAAVGLRIFVPFLLVSVAANLGRVTLDPGFAFLATKAALTTFTVATLLEVVAYHVPWLDHALDLIAAPAAAVGGALLAAATMVHLDPAVRWPLAIIAGGGVAGLVQMGTAALRVGSTVTTAGLGNPLLATAETGASVVLAFLALALPLVIGILVLPLLFVALRLRRSRRIKSRPRG